jgi:hypothetical protein
MGSLQHQPNMIDPGEGALSTEKCDTINSYFFPSLPCTNVILSIFMDLGFSYFIWQDWHDKAQLVSPD